MSAPAVDRVPAQRADGGSAEISPFAAAVANETGMVGELIALLRAQREAVAVDDLAALDEATLGVNRTLGALGRVQREREAARTAPLAEDDRKAWESLRAAARLLADETAHTQRLLRQALGAGDQYARLVRSAPGTGGGVSLIDRKG